MKAKVSVFQAACIHSSEFCPNPTDNVISTHHLFTSFIDPPLPSNTLSDFQIFNLRLHSMCREYLTGERNHNGITQSKVSPHEFVKNVTRTVSISSMRQPFARICEGKNWLTNQKMLTCQALYRLDNKPQHNPTKDHKTSMQKL